MLRRTVVRGIVVALLAMLAAGCGGQEPPAPLEPEAAMRPDAAGLATFEYGEGYGISDGRPLAFGPARLALGGRVYEVPAGTTAYGACPPMYPDNGIVAPCLLQIGLKGDGSVEWVRAMTAETKMLPQPGSEIVFAGRFTYGGRIASLGPGEVVLEDGAVLVLAQDVHVRCTLDGAEPALADLVGRGVQVTLREEPLEAVEVGCVYGD